MAISNRKATSLARVKFNPDMFDAVKVGETGTVGDLILDFDPSEGDSDGKVYDRPEPVTKDQADMLAHCDELRRAISVLMRLKTEDLRQWSKLINSCPPSIDPPAGLYDLASYKREKTSKGTMVFTCHPYKVERTRDQIVNDGTLWAVNIVNEMVAQYDAANIAHTSHKRFIADLGGYMRQTIRAEHGEEGKRLWARPNKGKLEGLAAADQAAREDKDKADLLNMFDDPTPATPDPVQPADPAPVTPPKRGKGK